MTRPCPGGEHDEHDAYVALSACRDVFDVLVGKWSALALGALVPGPQRFGALQRRLDGVSPSVLTPTLRQLENDGFVSRTVYPAMPSRVEYALTDLGRGAAEPLVRLREWVEENLDLIRADPQKGGNVPSKL